MAADPTSDFTVTGRLLTPLWLVCGIGWIVSSLHLATAGAPVAAAVGVACVLVGVGLLFVPWDRVPRFVPLGVPYLASALLVFTGAATRGLLVSLVVAECVLLMWTGSALRRRDLVIATGLGAVSIFTAAASELGAIDGLWITAVIWPIAAVVGGVMHWLRNGLEEAKAQAAAAHEEAARVNARSAAERETAERERAAHARAELERREQLQGRVAAEAASLASAADGVSGQTIAVASAVEEMAGAMRELAGAAHTSDQITVSVAVMAAAATEVMQRLTAASGRILSAADVIQAIAEQTNLLALNATIESARAGEAGRGFAVVANEVKDLARQSGENADAIGQTLAEVQHEVAEAVARVTDIASAMGDLQAQHTTLAAAIEEQSVTIVDVSSRINSAAADAGRIAAGVQSLESIAGGM